MNACTALLLAMMSAGCSLSLPLGSMLGDPETTASVPASPLHATLDAEDWRRAQAAFSLAVDPQGSGQVVNWENPASKRKGSFVPTGNIVLADNTICRPFRATIIDQGAAKATESRHIGRACRTGPGEWAIREVVAEASGTGKALTTASTGPLRLGSPAARAAPDQPLPAATTTMLPSPAAGSRE